MSVFDSFLNSVWTLPLAMQRGPIAMRPAPALATGEVVLASLYRNIGFEHFGEGEAGPLATKLKNHLSKARRALPADEDTPEMRHLDVLDALLHRILDSPKRKASDYLHVTPLTPYCTAFCNAARQKGNPWNPGALVHRMIWTGSATPEHAVDLWRKLFDALSIEADSGDLDSGLNEDAFAVWVDQVLKEQVTQIKPDLEWKIVTKTSPEARLSPAEYASIVFPAKHFVRDLEMVLDLKTLLTRRQWTSVIEALLRIATTSHVLWICGVVANLGALVDQAFMGKVPTDAIETRANLFKDAVLQLDYGGPVMGDVNNRIRAYLWGRARLTLAINWLEQVASEMKPDELLLSAENVHAMLLCISENSSEALAKDFRESMNRCREMHDSQFRLSSGVGNNLSEFIKYTAARRLVTHQELRSYDQGYIFEQPTTSTRAAYRVRFGPVASLLMTHCALKGEGVPMGISQLSAQLRQYGIMLDPNAVGNHPIGHQLRTLGVITDSPDAESGMLLSPPFNVKSEPR